MKKSFKKVLLLVAVLVMTTSMVLGLAGCGAKVTTESLQKAVAEWESATGEKKAVDNLVATVSTDIGSFGPIEITLDATITRTYTGSELKKVAGKVNAVRIGGAVLSKLGNLLGMFGLDAELLATLEDILANGLELKDIAEGSISLSGENYVLEGTVYLSKLSDVLGTLLGDTPLEDIVTTEPLNVKKELIDGVLEDTGNSDLRLDMISLYDMTTGTSTVVDKSLQTTIDPNVAIKHLTDRLFGIVDKFLDGDLDDMINGFAPDEAAAASSAATLAMVKTKINDFVKAVFGASATVKTALTGLIDLGDSLVVTSTYDSGKLVNLKAEQTVVASMNKTTFSKTIDEVLKIANVDPSTPIGPLTVGSLMNTVKGVIFPNGITLNVKVSFDTTLTY